MKLSSWQLVLPTNGTRHLSRCFDIGKRHLLLQVTEASVSLICFSRVLYLTLVLYDPFLLWILVHYDGCSRRALFWARCTDSRPLFVNLIGFICCLLRKTCKRYSRESIFLIFLLSYETSLAVLGHSENMNQSYHSTLLRLLAFICPFPHNTAISDTSVNSIRIVHVSICKWYYPAYCLYIRSITFLSWLVGR